MLDRLHRQRLLAAAQQDPRELADGLGVPFRQVVGELVQRVGAQLLDRRDRLLAVPPRRVHEAAAAVLAGDQHEALLGLRALGAGLAQRVRDDERGRAGAVPGEPEPRGLVDLVAAERADHDLRGGVVQERDERRRAGDVPLRRVEQQPVGGEAATRGEVLQRDHVHVAVPVAVVALVGEKLFGEVVRTLHQQPVVAAASVPALRELQHLAAAEPLGQRLPVGLLGEGFVRLREHVGGLQPLVPHPGRPGLHSGRLAAFQALQDDRLGIRAPPARPRRIDEQAGQGALGGVLDGGNVGHRSSFTTGTDSIDRQTHARDARFGRFAGRAGSQSM
ncbi:hypothetical protein GCM10010402_54580 [Actinomadura luteofluorescens]